MAGFNVRIALPQGVSLDSLAKGDRLNDSFQLNYRFYAESNELAINAYSLTSTVKDSGALVKMTFKVQPNAATGMQTLKFADFNPNDVVNSRHALAIRDPNAVNKTVTTFHRAIPASFFVYSDKSDFDGDGLPDAWEKNYGLDAMKANAISEDLDRDGINNLTEFKAGTLPNDPGSKPIYQYVTPEPGITPVANAGQDRIAVEGRAVILDGSQSTIQTGKIASFVWRQTSGPAVALIKDAGAEHKPHFVAPQVSSDTELGFDLMVVSDQNHTSAADSVVVTVRDKSAITPLAKVGIGQSAVAGEWVHLDGSGSYDLGGKIAKYKWVQLSPQTPKIKFKGKSNVAKPKFIAPVVNTDTLFTFQLVTTNSAKQNSMPVSERVMLKVENHAPIAQAGEDLSIRVGAITVLDARQSTDPDLDVISYSWTQIGGPAVSLFGANAARPSFVAPSEPAMLTFELQVEDKNGAVSVDQVIVNVEGNHAPTVNLGDDKSFYSNEIVTLNSQVSDPDGDDVEFEWKQIAGVPVALLGAATPEIRFLTPALDTPETLEFKLVATDQSPSAGFASDSIAIQIQPQSSDQLDCSHAVVTPANLWPSSGKFVAVSIGGIQSNSTLATGYDLKINEILQDEPLINLLDYDNANENVLLGIPARTLAKPLGKDVVYVRPVKKSPGSQLQTTTNGKVYTVYFTATQGNDLCKGAVKIGLPTKKGGTAIDDGESFDSAATSKVKPK